MITFEELTSTFKESIFTWDYFTNFEKVKKNIKKIEKELNILNYLIDKDNLDDEFIELIKEYPNIRKALPILIATRKEKISNMEVITDVTTLVSENKKHIFYDDLTKKIEEELLLFFNESGLKDIFQDKHIKNLVDYCFGVEVGLDTNARKNRTGSIMENIVSSYVRSFCFNNKDFYLIEQATKKKIEDILNFDLKIDKNNRIFDFALFDKPKNKLYLMEVNYYSSGGSKLKATAGEYKSLNNLLRYQEVTFIWVTDGKGWLTALNSLQETFEHNDHVINLNMLKNNILDDICL